MSKEIFKSQFRECPSSLRVEYDCIEDKDEAAQECTDVAIKTMVLFGKWLSRKGYAHHSKDLWLDLCNEQPISEEQLMTEFFESDEYFEE